MCIGKNATLKPMKASQKCQRPMRSFIIRPVNLREPVIDRAEQRKDGAADEHIMEMGDDEIRVVDLGVERHGSEHDAGQSAEPRR